MTEFFVRQLFPQQSLPATGHWDVPFVLQLPPLYLPKTATLTILRKNHVLKVSADRGDPRAHVYYACCLLYNQGVSSDLVKTAY
jgi:hypothetical protein